MIHMENEIKYSKIRTTKDKLERRDSMKGCTGKYLNQKDKK